MKKATEIDILNMQISKVKFDAINFEDLEIVDLDMFEIVKSMELGIGKFISPFILTRPDRRLYNLAKSTSDLHK